MGAWSWSSSDLPLKAAPLASTDERNLCILWRVPRRPNSRTYCSEVAGRGTRSFEGFHSSYTLLQIRGSALRQSSLDRPARVWRGMWYLQSRLDVRAGDREPETDQEAHSRRARHP